MNLVSLNELIKIATHFAIHVYDKAFGPYRLTVRRKDGSRIRVELLTRVIDFAQSKIIMATARKVDDVKDNGEQLGEESEVLRWLAELNKAMSLVSICSDCKKIRTAKDEWITIERFLLEQFNLQFSHGLCSACLEKRSTELL